MKEESEKAIGVFDSGVGGLTVVQQLLDILPGEEIVYFGDTARVPYGTKSPRTVMRFSRENLRFLKSKNVKLIVIACNTASSLVLPQLREEEDIPIVGVIEPGAKAAVLATKSDHVGVIGTPATINSGAYRNALNKLKPGIEIWSLACPLFVPLVEEGWLEDEVTYLTAQKYLSPFIGYGIDTLVLGCTHYPLLKDIISGVVGEDIVLVDSAEETAKEVERVLMERNLERTEVGRDAGVSVYVSDIPWRFKDIAERFLGKSIDNVEHVSV